MTQTTDEVVNKSKKKSDDLRQDLDRVLDRHGTRIRIGIKTMPIHTLLRPKGKVLNFLCAQILEVFALFALTEHRQREFFYKSKVKF